MFSKIVRAFSRKKVWEQVFLLQQQDELTLAWDSLHFAVNPKGLIEAGDWAPPVRFFEYSPRKNPQTKWQWIGSKKQKSNLLKSTQGEFELSSKEALSEMLNWNALTGSLILEGLRTLSAPFQKEKLDLASIRQAEENKALEWMRVSFDLLKKAITNCPNEFNPKRDQTLFSQSVLFWHEHSEGSSLARMRVIAFNLDITLHPYPIVIEEREVWALGVIIYNHKDSQAQEPSLSATFIYQPRLAIDLVATILETSKQHFYWPLEG